MEITVQDIAEKLIPHLCSLKIGCRKCNDPRCSKVIKDLQDWIDNLRAMENNKLHCIGQPKNWAK